MGWGGESAPLAGSFISSLDHIPSQPCQPSSHGVKWLEMQDGDRSKTTRSLSSSSNLGFMALIPGKVMAVLHSQGTCTCHKQSLKALRPTTEHQAPQGQSWGQVMPGRLAVGY